MSYGETDILRQQSKAIRAARSRLRELYARIPEPEIKAIDLILLDGLDIFIEEKDGKGPDDEAIKPSWMS